MPPLQTWPCALTHGDVATAKIWDGIAVLAPPNMFGFAVAWSAGLDQRCLRRPSQDAVDLDTVRGDASGRPGGVRLVAGWPEGSAFHCAASALASATDGSFAAASLRNSAARPKVFPMG